MSRARIFGGISVGLLLVAGGLVAFGLQRLSEAPEDVAARLEAALGATCRVEAVVPLDLRSVEISGVACAFEDGPFTGAAAPRLALVFSSMPLAGGLPPVEQLNIYGAVLRVRERTSPDASDPEDAPGGGDASAGEDTDLSATLEAAGLRFADLTEAIAAGRGGDRVPALTGRLAEGGRVEIDRAVLQSAGEEVLVRELAIRATRSGDTIEAALATSFATGGLATFEGTLAESGLRSGRLQVQDWPVASALEEAGGGRFRVTQGTAHGALEYRPGASAAGEWAAEATLTRLVVGHEFLGREVVPLPDVGLRGTLRPTRVEDQGLVLALEESKWSVADQGGLFHSVFGPLGAAGDPLVTASVEAKRLSLGRLLEQLPEALLPSEWAQEIQGSMDFELELGGPVHDRSRWEMDWTGDFSRMHLASGELAREVDLLKGPFHHEFPDTATDAGDRPMRRILGPEGKDFVPISGISKHLIAAVVSTEDAGFFAHSGFETKELKEAVLENLREGEGRGGSTITQQLAKNLFLSGERSIARKLKEAVIAWRLEEDLPKRRILEIYLNIAEWGPGLYGVRDAADHYFNRTPSRLKPEEAAFLASLLPSPRRYHGYYHGRGVTPHLRERIGEILSTMRRLGNLDAREYHLARGEDPEMSWCPLTKD